eukprot:6556287-Prymnesium_polylepis.1
MPACRPALVDPHPARSRTHGGGGGCKSLALKPHRSTADRAAAHWRAHRTHSAAARPAQKSSHDATPSTPTFSASDTRAS